jgi:hypothetical protein
MYPSEVSGANEAFVDRGNPDVGLPGITKIEGLCQVKIHQHRRTGIISMIVKRYGDRSAIGRNIDGRIKKRLLPVDYY